MNCRNWEERIALYAGGDLSPREAGDVERHLAECSECREFAAAVTESLAALREVHEEPLEAAHLAAVRARVLAQLEPKRRSAWRWAWIPALAAVLVAGFFLAGTGRAPVQPPLVALAPPPAPLVPPPAPVNPEPPPAKKPPQRVVRVHRAKRTPPSAEPLMVKLITDDPNVVIYWIAN